MANNTNFYASGAIALSLFFIFFFSFVMMMFQPSKVNSFALKKDNFISIALEVPKIKTSSAKKIEKKAAVEEVLTPKNQNIDVNNLFSDVWTKKISTKKEPTRKVNSKRLSQIQNRIKTSEKNDVQSISDKLSNLENQKSKSEDTPSSTAEQVNEYLAKIQAIVYQHFNVPPNSQGSSVKTVIELSSLGKVIDFRVLTYSTNSDLNQEADKIGARLKHVIFPINPQRKSSRTVVILISKE